MRFQFLILLIFALLACTACGGGGGSSTSESGIILSGTLVGPGLAQSNWLHKLIDIFIEDAHASLDSPDKMVIVSRAGNILKEININEDGYFEINLSSLSSNSFMIFIKNSTTNTYFGHIKLGTDNVLYSLDGFDSSTISSDLDLGLISIDDLHGPNIDNIDIFSEADKQFLRKVARNDDAFALYINKLSNQGIDAYLSQAFLMGSPENYKNTAFDINSFSKASSFWGVRPLFHYYGPEATTIDTAILYPPQAINYMDITVGDNDYIRYADMTSGIEKEVPLGSSDDLRTIEFPFIDRIPQGQWFLENFDNQNLLGAFYFSGGEPFDSTDIFKAFIPAPTIHTDSTDNVVTIDLDFYRQDENGFELVTKDYLDIFITDLLVSYVNNGNSFSSNLNPITSSAEDTTLIFSHNEPVGFADVARYIVSYRIGQAKYQFFIQ